MTLEVSKLSGWLNADAACRESNGGHAVRDEVRPGRREAAGDRGARTACRGGLDCRLGAGHGEERLRTPNMRYMVVTLEVSQPDMSALNEYLLEKSELMSVIADTCQVEMGPYVAVAVAAL